MRSFKAWPVVCLRCSMTRVFSLFVSASRLAAFKTSTTLRRMSFSSSSCLMRSSGVPSKTDQVGSLPPGAVALAGMEGPSLPAALAQLYTVAALGTPSALATSFPSIPPRTSLTASALVSGS